MSSRRIMTLVLIINFGHIDMMTDSKLILFKPTRILSELKMHLLDLVHTFKIADSIHLPLLSTKCSIDNSLRHG